MMLDERKDTLPSAQGVYQEQERSVKTSKKTRR